MYIFHHVPTPWHITPAANDDVLGCDAVRELDTMSYQAPEFYVKHGYHVAGAFPDWDCHGHAKMHFPKSFTAPSSSAP